MSAIVTTNLRLKNSSLIKEEFTDGANSLYLFVSKPTPWADESSPDPSLDSIKFERSVREEMISLRKISSAEITSSIPRRDWVAGKYYDMYRDDYDGITALGVNYDSGAAEIKASLIDSNFFVLTDEFNVYKCIWNANRAASSIKPTGTSTSIITTSDGYKWKYMYSINTASGLKFSTKNHIPVQVVGVNPGSTSPNYPQYLVEQAAVNGSIDFCQVTNAGVGYTSNASLPIAVVGDGTGFVATATTNSSGQVTGVSISNAGSGYTYATMTVTGSNTTPATIVAIMSPVGGHGKNAVAELGGTFITISASIGDDLSGDTLVDNSYRVLGLLFNPFAYGTSTVLTASTANALKTIGISAGITGNFTINENLISTGTPTNRGRFVSWNSSTKQLKYIRNRSNVGSDFNVSQTVTGQSSGANGVITSIINPEVDTYSGDMIFIETRKSITRDASQKEEIRITIET